MITNVMFTNSRISQQAINLVSLFILIDTLS